MYFSRFVTGIVISSALLACGGGGGGGGQQIGGNNDTMLSGQVLAPNGALASLENKNIGDKFLNAILPSVLADFSGVSPVANTTVELVRLNLTGSIDGVPLATTTSNASGGYSFNLTDLGVAPGTTLAVRVGSGFLRAFVTGTDVDITVESETVFQRVVAEVGGTNELTNYTPAEIEALVTGLRRVTSGSISGGGNIADAVTDATQDLSVNNTDLNDFASSAASVGEETRGPGDNNYIVNGVITYNGSRSNNGNPATAYTNVITVSNAQVVQGNQTQQLAANNLFDNGSFSFFFANTLTGILDFTDVVNDESDEPTTIVFFPYLENESVVLFNSLNIDGENFRVTYESFFVDSLNVPANNFNDVITVRIDARSLTSTNQTTVDFFFAPNVGLIRQDAFILIDGNAINASEEASSVSVSG